MKILFVGQLGYGSTTQMRHDVLVGMGHELRSIDSLTGWNEISWVQRWYDRKFNTGEAIKILNNRILQVVEDFKPDL